MRTLTILYDADCGFCERCRRWLSNQATVVALEFVAAGSSAAFRRFPDLVTPGRVEELIVVSDDGGVYRNDSAWLICLFATRDYRHWSYRLAAPAMRPLARAVYGCLASKRYAISRCLGTPPSDDEVLDGFAPEAGRACVRRAVRRRGATRFRCILRKFLWTTTRELLRIGLGVGIGATLAGRTR